jgi:hypothetical protein
VRVKKNTYSVPSKLIGLKLDAHVGESEVRFTYEGNQVCLLPPSAGLHCSSPQARSSPAGFRPAVRP